MLHISYFPKNHGLNRQMFFWHHHITDLPSLRASEPISVQRNWTNTHLSKISSTGHNMDYCWSLIKIRTEDYTNSRCVYEINYFDRNYEYSFVSRLYVKIKYIFIYVIRRKREREREREKVSGRFRWFIPETGSRGPVYVRPQLFVKFYNILFLLLFDTGTIKTCPTLKNL